MTAQGEVYMLDTGTPFGSEPGYLRPWVVIQNDVLNNSRLATILAAAITSNVERGGLRGNVRLSAGEAGLNRDSVVIGVSIATLDRRRLGQPIGKLSPTRIREVADAIVHVIQPRAIPPGMATTGR